MPEFRSTSPIDFSVPVADQGYRWWYVDALSDDGRTGIVIIAFIGSVFSPYYAWARERAAAGARSSAASSSTPPPHPLAFDHCAINVALYRPESGRWCMTERGAASLSREANWLRIGPSSLTWEADALRIDINERCAPWPHRLQGTVLLRPNTVMHQKHSLSEAGGHIWHPIAPRARVEVNMAHPYWRWSGHGYWDSNAGDAPLESAFRRWNWSRARLLDGRLAVLYDVERRDGSQQRLALEFAEGRPARPFTPPGSAFLPTGLWGVARSTRSEQINARLVRVLEDGPFYTRSSISSHVLGQPVVAMHESLDLDRITRNWVRMLLPFRMPRKA